MFLEKISSILLNLSFPLSLSKMPKKSLSPLSFFLYLALTASGIDEPSEPARAAPER